MKKTLIIASAVLLLGVGAGAQNTADTAMMKTANGKIGRLSLSEFQQRNQQGNQMVAAIKPSSKTLSAADQQLLTQVAAGGQMQLAMSQAAIGKLQSPEAKILAQSEIEEQTGVTAKVREMASAKGMTLSSAASDTAMQAAVSKVQGTSGNVDAYYVRQSGVQGHILLEKTMTTVMSKAQDEDLKKLATATLPVIRMHLSVSRDLDQSMSGGKTNSNGTK